MSYILPSSTCRGTYCICGSFYSSYNNNSGNFVDAGKFIGVSTNPAVTSAVIDANNIYVQAGGSLTSVLSAAHAGTFPSLSLSLNALNDVANAGTISSSGNLNLYAGSGNIVNSGLVASTSGNINLSTSAAQNLNVNGANGTFQAANGAINLRDASYNGTGNTYVNGGNLLSQTLNIYAGNGVANVNVDQLTGTVNATGYGAHVMAATLYQLLQARRLRSAAIR